MKMSLLRIPVIVLLMLVTASVALSWQANAAEQGASLPALKSIQQYSEHIRDLSLLAGAISKGLRGYDDANVQYSYAPGAGAVFTARVWANEANPRAWASVVVKVVSGIAPLLSSLTPDEYITIAVVDDGTPTATLVVRCTKAQASDPTQWEIYIWQ